MKKFDHVMFIKFFLLICSLAFAQAGAKTFTSEIYFSVFPLASGNWQGIYFAPRGNPDDQKVELRFNPHERSVKYKYQGESPLVFFRTSTDSEGNIQYHVVYTLNLEPKKYENQFILFFEPNNDGSSFTVSVMVDSEETFPDESLVFFNTMNITFRGVLGDQQLTLSPGLSKPISTTKFLDQPAPIILAIEQDNDIHLVLRNQLRFSPERRTILILRKPANPNSLRIRTQRLTEFTGNRSP